MPPGIGYGDGTTGLLEGLVGGFLMGHDFRTQREDRRVSAAERVRRQQIEDEERRVAAATRQRAEAIQDVNLRAEHGLAYDPTTPSGASATPLTRAVQTAYNVPEGFRRVGPSVAERRAAELASLRRGAGQFLMASPEERATMFGDPNVVAGLGEMGFDIDAYIESTTPKAVEGNPVNWSTQNTAGGLIQVNPQTGDVRPVIRDGAQVTAPTAAGGRPTEVQMRLGQVLPRAESSLQVIERLVEAFDGTVPASTLLRRAGIGGQYATPEQEQLFNQAAEALATSILRAESGAAITADEQRSYRDQFIPSPGDRPATVRQKLNAIRQTLARMRQLSLAGGAQSMDETTELSPDNPYR